MVERGVLIALVLLCLPSAALGQEVPLPFETELGRKYRAALEFVLVPADRLPPGCGLARDTVFRVTPRGPILLRPSVTFLLRPVVYF